jgi:hypothetical protein
VRDDEGLVNVVRLNYLLIQAAIKVSPDHAKSVEPVAAHD